MESGSFYRLQREMVVEGQLLLAGISRGVLRRTDPDTYDVLSDASGEVFLEPLLFAYFSALKGGKPLIELPQIILGHVDSSIWPEAIEVYADTKGRIYLPKIGYFVTLVKNRRLLLRCDGVTKRFSLEDGGVPTDFRFEEILHVPGTSIEVCRYPNSLYEMLLADSSDQHRAVEIKEDVNRYVGSIARALQLIHEKMPEFYQDLLKTVRQIVVFHSSELNSCATLGAHGVAFINFKEGDDEVFFLDDLVHQGGHVIFNAFTAKRKDYCAIDPDAPLSKFTGKENDRRSLYTVLHGCYTEFMMIHCLLTCDERGIFSGRQQHELRGRLAAVFQKSLIDLKTLSHTGLLTELGASLRDTFQQLSDDVRRQRPELLRYNLSNQPYNFSYERFIELNPIGDLQSNMAV
jgi:hypothetical protein